MATKYVSSLTGPEMDAALIDMAYHNSEAYAVGTRNGVAVGSGDVTYHNNAKYYAEQTGTDAQAAEAAAARAEAAVPAGTAGAVFFDRAQSLTTAQQAQARANIAAGGTNPNLLDNWYFVGGGSQLGDGVFPINQRGQTSYTGGRSIDRWRCWQASPVTLTAAGLTFATGANADGLFQYFPKGKFESLYGETVTASLLLTDGTLYTATGTASADCWISKSFSGGYFAYVCNGTEANFRINLNANQSKSIKAGKLEKGAYSTLLNDFPPDFGAELRKCQRYLFVLDIPAYLRLSSVAIASDTKNGAFPVVTPVNMAKSAIAASISGSLTIGGVGPVSSIPWATAFGNNVYVAFVVNGAMVAGTMYPVGASAQVTKLILSAEL